MNVPDYKAMWDSMAPEEQKELIRKVMREELRELEGEELEHTWLFLQFLTPEWISNNQQFSSAHYIHNDLVYHVHFVNDDIPMIEVEPASDAWVRSSESKLR